MHELSSLSIDSFSPEYTVARDVGQHISWRQLLNDMSAVRRNLRTRDGDWALFESDSYRFTVALLAILAEKRKVFLAGDNAAGTCRELRSRGLNFIGDFDIPDRLTIAEHTPKQAAETFQLGGKIIIYTSGSTGQPKPVSKGLNQLDAELHSLQQQWGHVLADSLVVGTVSHQHFYGLLFLVLWPLCSGRTFWRRPFLDPMLLASAMLVHQCDACTWIMSPAHLHRLNTAMPWPALCQHLRAVFSSGGPLRADAAAKIEAALGQAPFEVLGSSETGGIAWRQQQTGNTTWQALPNVDIRCEKSALAVRSPMLADNNWYITADSAHLLADGRFQLGARLDRIIKVEGKRVSLADVEHKLLTSKLITDCTTLLLPDNFADRSSGKRQCLAALIVLSDTGIETLTNSGLHKLQRQLRATLLEQLPTIATPRRFRLVDQLPRNSQGKLQQSKLTALFKEQRLPQVIQIQQHTDSAVFKFYLARNNVYLAGHFPGKPILPGVTQLYWAEYYGRQYLHLSGHFCGMKAVKFQTLSLPDCVLELSLSFEADTGRLDFHFSSKAGQHSKGHLYFGQTETRAL